MVGLLAKMTIRLEKSETGCKLMEGTESLCEERNSVTAAGDDDGVRSSHQHT